MGIENAKGLPCLCAVFVFSLLLVGCGSSGISEPLAKVAPTANPLVAQYSIRQFHEGLSAWVEFGLDTHYGRQTSAFGNNVTAPGGQVLNILVAGMKPQTTYHMRAHVDWIGGSWVDQDQTFTTGALPSSLALPGISVTRPNPALSPAPGVELLSLIAPLNTNMLQSVVTDLQGNIIWYYPLGGVPIKPMQNGHFMLNLSSDLREVDLAGNTIRDVSGSQVNSSLQAKGYSFSLNGEPFSHDVLTLPNGHWIGLVKVSKDFTNLPGYPGTITILGDGLVDIDPSGNVVWAWSAFDYLDVNRFL